jgi:hypothetical protein
MPLNPGDITWDDNPQQPDANAVQWDAPADAQPKQDLAQVNEQMRAMFHSGTPTADIVAFGKQHGVDPNPEQIDHARKNGMDVQFVQPEQLGIGQQLLDSTKNDVAGIAQGAAALPDMAAEGVGKVLSAIPNAISHALTAAGHTDAAKWIQDNITHSLANPAQVGDMVESVAPTPDSASGKAARFVGSLFGGAVTVPAAATESVVAKLVGEVPKAIIPAARVAQSAARETAQAAQELGIDLPAFAVKGPKAEAQAVAKSKGGFGASNLGESADTALDQSRAARDKIASDLAPSRELDASLGDEVSTAATDARTAERARIGRMYDSGDQIMGDTPVSLDQTKQAISSLIDQEDAALVPSAAAPILKQLQAKIGNGGPMTAAALRSSAQNIKSLMTSNSIDATTADHVLKTVTEAMNGDIAAAANGTEAAKIYANARSQWAASKQLDKSVLKPILGASFQNTGDQVARNLVAAAKTNGSRLAKMFAILPEDVANGARSSLIARLGASSDAAQNAAGDAFSLRDFLKNWNQLKGSRNLIFPKETVQALDRLAQIAEHGKTLEKVAANGAAAQSGGLKQALHSAPLGLGAAASYLTHDPKEIVLGMLATGLSSLKQYRSAKLLASTDFAKKLAATPLSLKGASSYWSRPWVATMARKNPIIAGEILAFQKSILAHANDNGIVSAASADTQQQGQQQ